MKQLNIRAIPYFDHNKKHGSFKTAMPLYSLCVFVRYFLSLL